MPFLKPEILSPAGGWDCARAAVENGADAIYFGTTAFNARARANNFAPEELADLMAFLHRRGVRGYLTFNTLVFQDELADAQAVLRTVIASGVDAAIVQDVGICTLIRAISPDFPIHASTQMTITSSHGVKQAKELGCNLAVIARENSIAEIEAIQKETAAQGAQIPLETFVHGALCVAYSGQCLTSESFGGRSANRGQCAQSCRLPYELLVDGEPVDLGDRKYLLSPQDLAGLEVVPDLIVAGVSSLKIEGRLKTPQYVAAITRAYRDAVDQCHAALEAGQPLEDVRQLAKTLRERDTYTLEMSFSRGLYTGWLRGIQNQELAHARFGKKRGAVVGEAIDLIHGRDAVLIKLVPGAGIHLKAGDGLVFGREGADTENEEGGFARTVDFDVEDPAQATEAIVRFGPGAVKWNRITELQKVYKTRDPQLEKDLDATWKHAAEGGDPNFRRQVFFIVAGAAGEPLRVSLRDEEGRAVAGESEMALAPAAARALDAATLEAQLGRLGNSPFALGGMDLGGLAPGLYLPMSALNKLRRDLTDRLLALREEKPRWTLRENTGARTLLSASSPASTNADKSVRAPVLIPVVRHLAQAQAALASGAETLYFDPENPRDFRQAGELTKRFRDLAGKPIELFLAPPRVFKHGEDWILKQAAQCVGKGMADGILARNAAHIQSFAGRFRLRGDFSLNVANDRTAQWFLAKGLESVTASYDLNAAQLDALIGAMDASKLEITIHQHMPMFHMEHCVFCAFMSTGKDYRDCGRPCEEHTVHLLDRYGAKHQLKADAGCRNTLYNELAQTGAEYVPHLLARGVKRLRVEFMDEDPQTVTATLSRYGKLLRGEITGQQLWEELRLKNQLGVTRGTLNVVE